MLKGALHRLAAVLLGSALAILIIGILGVGYRLWTPAEGWPAEEHATHESFDAERVFPIVYLYLVERVRAERPETTSFALGVGQDGAPAGVIRQVEDTFPSLTFQALASSPHWLEESNQPGRLIITTCAQRGLRYVDVQCSYQLASRWGLGLLLRLELTRDGWVIVEDDVQWIS